MTGQRSDIWPTELRLRSGGKVLQVAFDNGQSFDLHAEYLRVESPSAEVQGHSVQGRQWIGGKKDVAIRSVNPVGNYAVRLVFSDGHDTGIFSWETLHRLGANHGAIWQNYLTALAEHGLRREP